MRGCTDKLRKLLSGDGLIIFGAIIDSRSGAAVEMFHETGFDALLIDREHSALNDETILEHIRLARALDFPCMVRAADHSYHEINRVLDQAPDGIFVPRIRSREEAENIVRTAKYPPLGVRGLGASTCPAGKYMGWGASTEMVKHFNETAVLGIQIETAEALADLDGILSVPGIDLAVVGNDDLSLGMGILGQFESDEYIDAVKRIIAACKRRGVVPGIACGDPVKVKFWAEQGMRVFWAAADIVLMWSAAREAMNSLESTLNREASK